MIATDSQRITAEANVTRRMGAHAWSKLTGPEQDTAVTTEIRETSDRRKKAAQHIIAPAPVASALSPEQCDAIERAAIGRMLDHWRGAPLKILGWLVRQGTPDDLRGALCVSKEDGRQGFGKSDPLGSTSRNDYARAAVLAAYEAIEVAMLPPPREKTK